MCGKSLISEVSDYLYSIRHGDVEKNVKISITIPEDQKDRWKTEAEKKKKRSNIDTVT